MKPIIVDGIPLNKGTVSSLRTYLISLRDEVLQQGCMDDAFNLSLIIAVLAHYIELLDE